MKIISIIILLTISLCSKGQILKQPIPDKLVVLTFDDATASHYSFVAPLLKQYGFNATFFICEFPPNFTDSTKYMNWRQIKQLDEMGFEVANHGHNHKHLRGLKPEQVRAQVEYIENKCDSMYITHPVSFAYPAYSLDSSAVEILKQKNYALARVGGDRPYNPLVDYPLLIPSWAMTDTNKQQIMDAFQEAKEGKIVVLTIHGVPDIEHPWVNTSPELFKEYMQYLSDNNFKVIALRDLAKYIDVTKAQKGIELEF